MGSKMIARIRGLIQGRALTFVTGVVCAVLCFIGINAAMEPVSSPEYCGSKCHEMAGAYQSWELSSHGANRYGIVVECVDCHLPSKDKYFTHLAAKAYAGGKDVLKHHFGGEYDLDKVRTKVLEHIPNQRCLNCHDNLLSRPGSVVSRIVHNTALNQLDAPETRCIKCHENAGHRRKSRLFSP